MRCTSPRTVGFQADGRTLAWSQKNFSKEYATFQLPCGKCIECRLDYARQWAIRCVHEASMHPNNCFITLTYSDDHIGDNKLDYEDFQLFMKKLRKTQNEPIGFFCTGEYGEKTKRKHWHAILFNYRPRDAKHLRFTDQQDEVFTSQTLEKIWGLGRTEFGSVTFKSAGYCARYSAKKLGHGKDGDHAFEPISKKSNKHAIGKRFLESFYKDIFNHGEVILRDGSKSTIPRYYEKWLKEHHPDAWLTYIKNVKIKRIESAQARSDKEVKEHQEMLDQRHPLDPRPQTRNEVRYEITKAKLSRLHTKLKF